MSRKTDAEILEDIKKKRDENKQKAADVDAALRERERRVEARIAEKQKKANKAARAKRNQRLIKRGAELEKYVGVEITDDLASVWIDCFTRKRTVRDHSGQLIEYTFAETLRAEINEAQIRLESEKSAIDSQTVAAEANKAGNETSEQTDDETLNMSAPVPETKICPYCGGTWVVINGSHGKFWGHKDYRGSGCHKTEKIKGE